MAFENVLFIGAGGGNDIFSTVLAIDALRRKGYAWDRCSVAGMMSPFHEHLGFERVVSGLFRTGTAVTAHPYRRSGYTDPFPDPVVAHLAETERELGIEAVYAIDLREGSIGVSRTLREMFLNGMFDLMVLVDIGGDILGVSHATTMSPLFEAMALRGAIDAGIPFWVFVAGLGTDGETAPRDLTRAIDWIGPTRERLHPESVQLWERLYRQYVAKTSPSRSIPLAADIYRNWTLGSERQERFIVPGSPIGESYLQKICTHEVLFYYLFVQPRRIDNYLAVPCVNTFDWFVSTQLRLHTRNEANHRCERIGDGDVRAYLTPYSRNDPSGRRLAVLVSELDAFKRGEFDSAWMFPEDWELMADRAHGLFLDRRVAGLSLVRRAS